MGEEVWAAASAEGRSAGEGLPGQGQPGPLSKSLRPRQVLLTQRSGPRAPADFGAGCLLGSPLASSAPAFPLLMCQTAAAPPLGTHTPATFHWVVCGLSQPGSSICPWGDTPLTLLQGLHNHPTSALPIAHSAAGGLSPEAQLAFGVRPLSGGACPVHCRAHEMPRDNETH